MEVVTKRATGDCFVDGSVLDFLKLNINTDCCLAVMVGSHQLLTHAVC